MGLSEAADILRRHVIERRRRASIRSVNLDEDPRTAVPRMSDAQFADSCLLVRGVPEWTLQLLEIWVCESAGSTWTVDAVEMRGELKNIPIAQVAVKLTLRQAAARLGASLTYPQVKALYVEAMSIVTDNLVARANRAAL